MQGPDPILGRMEAAVLLAVEQANGGELSSVAQVLATFHTTFNRLPEAAPFAASTALLAEAHLVEYVEAQIGLTPGGRRLLRRTGAPWGRQRAERATALVGEIDEDDLAEAGSVPCPSESVVAAALGEMSQGELAGQALASGAELAPDAVGTQWLLGSRGFGLGGGRTVTFGERATGSQGPAPPMVQPRDAVPGPPQDPEAADRPADTSSGD